MEPKGKKILIIIVCMVIISIVLACFLSRDFCSGLVQCPLAYLRMFTAAFVCIKTKKFDLDFIFSYGEPPDASSLFLLGYRGGAIVLGFSIIALSEYAKHKNNK